MRFWCNTVTHADALKYFGSNFKLHLSGDQYEFLCSKILKLQFSEVFGMHIIIIMLTELTAIILICSLNTAWMS